MTTTLFVRIRTQLMSMQRQAIATWTRVPKEVPYYMNLHKPGVLERLQYRIQNKSVVYGIKCQVNDMIYIGSSFTPGRRLYKHLIMGDQSNAALQSDLSQYGLSKFTAYILEEVTFPEGITYGQRRVHLHKAEQSYIDKFSREQLYNYRAASKPH